MSTLAFLHMLHSRRHAARAPPRYTQDAQCMQNTVTKRGTRSGAKPILKFCVQSELHFFCTWMRIRRNCRVNTVHTTHNGCWNRQHLFLDTRRAVDTNINNSVYSKFGKTCSVNCQIFLLAKPVIRAFVSVLSAFFFSVPESF